MGQTIVVVDQSVAADSNPHDVTIPGRHALASLLNAKQIDNGPAAEVDLTIVTTTPTADNQIYLKDESTVSIQVGTAIAVEDFLILEGEEIGENVKPK